VGETRERTGQRGLLAVGAQTRVVRTRERGEVKTQGGERRESYRGNTDSIQHLPPKMKDECLEDEKKARKR